MTSNSKKGVSFNPDEMVLADHVIENLIGPGLTVVASEHPIHRKIFQEQMALSIASGEKFLEILGTDKGRVLYVVHGIADYNEFISRVGVISDVRELLDVRNQMPRILRGCTKEIIKYKSTNSDLKIVFLGDFDGVKSPFKVWYEKSYLPQNASQKQTDTIAMNELRREMIVNNIQKLRNLAIELQVSIVIGDDLSSNKKLRSWQGLCHADTEIHVRKVNNQFLLEVRPNSNYVVTNSWDLGLDENLKRYFIKGSKKEEKMAKKENALQQNDKAILDVLISGEIMNPPTISEETGIERTTVYKRLGILERNEWVVRIENSNGRLFMFNSNKKRSW